jgi:hypothetical protein
VLSLVCVCSPALLVVPAAAARKATNGPTGCCEGRQGGGVQADGRIEKIEKLPLLLSPLWVQREQNRHFWAFSVIIPVEPASQKGVSVVVWVQWHSTMGVS